MEVNGEAHYLWRAVDHEAEILESYVSKTRDKSAALLFLKKAMKDIGNIDRHQVFKSKRDTAFIEWRKFLAE